MNSCSKFWKGLPVHHPKQSCSTLLIYCMYMYLNSSEHDTFLLLLHVLKSLFWLQINHWLNKGILPQIIGNFISARSTRIEITISWANRNKIYRGYYMPTRGYEFYLRVVNSISHSFAVLTREISSWPREDKIHIHKRACNILFII